MGKDLDTSEIAEMLENFEAEEIELEDQDQEDPTDDEEREDGNQDGEDDQDDTDDKSGEDEDGEQSELERLRAELAERDRTIAALARKGKEKDSDKDSESDLTDSFEIEEPEYEEQEFISDDFDIDELTPDKLNSLLNSVAKAAVNIGAKAATKQTLLAIPAIVKHNVSVQSSIQSAVKEFYDHNKDLLEFKEAVAAKAQSLASKHPDWELNKLFAEAGKATRKALGIAKAKSRRTKQKKTTIRGQKGRRTSGQLKGLEKEISDMLSV